MCRLNDNDSPRNDDNYDNDDDEAANLQKPAGLQITNDFERCCFSPPRCVCMHRPGQHRVYCQVQLC